MDLKWILRNRLRFWRKNTNPNLETRSSLIRLSDGHGRGEGLLAVDGQNSESQLEVFHPRTGESGAGFPSDLHILALRI